MYLGMHFPDLDLLVIGPSRDDEASKPSLRFFGLDLFFLQVFLCSCSLLLTLCFSCNFTSHSLPASDFGTENSVSCDPLIPPLPEAESRI